MTWIIPDALLDYFQNDTAWEEYNRRYQEWVRQLEGDPATPTPIVKEKKRIRCKACGQFLGNTHLEAAGQTWHLKEKCLTKLYDDYLSKNLGFDWKRKPWSVFK